MPNPSRHRSSGFTLIEVLVALAVVGVLVALLIPAVQAARRASARASCQNNLRQIGLALDDYLTTFGAYPTGEPPDPRRSAFVAILPGLDQQALFNAYNFQLDGQRLANSTVDGGRPAVFVCPSDAGTGPPLDGGPNAFYEPGAPVAGPVATTSYGLMYGTLPFPWEPGGPDPYGQINGCFNVTPGIAPAAITDGLSHTIFAGERAMGFYNEDRITPLGRWTLAFAPQSFVYATLPPNSILHAWSEPVQRTYSIWAEMVSSRHGGGANVLFGDGSARFVAESVDSWPIDPKANGPVGMVMWYDGYKNVPRPGVWQALATRAGGEPTGDY